MCTVPLRETLKAYIDFMETNALDPKIFPSVKELEREAVAEAGKLFSNPNATGYITSGGTESNIVALWIARELSGKKEVLAPVSVHYSVEKACALLGLKFIPTPLGEDHRADVEAMKEKMGPKTAAIVGTAGTTSLGLVDPIEEMAGIAGDRKCFFHVDASFGGFVLPLMNYPKKWDFTLPQVSSIAADPHKMGMVPIPAGLLLFRRKRWLRVLERNVAYLGTKTQTLLGTRPGASVAATWAAFKLLEKRKKAIERCLELTKKLARGIQRIETLDLITKPELNIVAFKSEVLKIQSIEKALERRGWIVSRTELPAGIRLVIMPHHSPSHIRSFLRDLKECVRELLSR